MTNEQLSLKSNYLLITSHLARTPQEPGHGSRHWLLMHALVGLHSGLMVHSGLQFGGEPKKLGKQLQAGPLLATTVHWLFGPQGEGWHGFSGTAGTSLMIISHRTNGFPE